MDYIDKYRSHFPYFMVTPPATTPVSLDEVKQHLRLDPSDTSQDTYLTFLIEAATNFAQEYMRRVLVNTEFKTYRDFFASFIELRRSPFVSLTSFKYLVSGSFVDVDSTLYYTTLEQDYSAIVLNSNLSYPTDGDDVLQKIEIVFVAGFGAPFPAGFSDIKLALLNHIAAIYENRGDCDVASIMSSLPATSKSMYDSYRIIESV